MGYGLFGKLPQKRDFVSVGLPHQVLHPFETWLQSAVAASRNEIGRDWQNYYMVAPIWNFWLGPQILGTTCAGALMPSVDQVGRYFPLAIIYVADPGEDLPPPLLDPLSGFYREIDQRLLAVLATEGQFEISSVLAGLPMPEPAQSPPFRLAGIAPQQLAAMRMPASAATASAAAPASPGAAESPAPASPPDAASSGPGAEPWDLPSMSDDVVASMRMVTAAAQVDPPGKTTSELWDDGAAPGEAVPDAPDDLNAAGTSEADNAASAPEAVTADALDDVAAGAEEAAKAAALEPSPDSTGDPGPSSAGAPEPLPPEPEVPAAPEPAAPTVEAEWVPPRIHVTEFKGGVLSYVEPNRSIAEAAGALIEADYRNASLARSFWWCEATPNASAQLHTREGLPDPYFFSRMLMWQPQ